jgi:hypothetical protein
LLFSFIVPFPSHQFVELPAALGFLFLFLSHLAACAVENVFAFCDLIAFGGKSLLKLS